MLPHTWTASTAKPGTYSAGASVQRFAMPSDQDLLSKEDNSTQPSGVGLRAFSNSARSRKQVFFLLPFEASSPYYYSSWWGVTEKLWRDHLQKWLARSGSKQPLNSQQRKPALATWQSRFSTTRPRAESGPDFVLRAVQLEQRGYQDTALDLLYDSIDELLHAGKFALCASILSDMNVSGCSADILLGLLTATLPAKSRIATRSWFFRRVESELRRRNELEAGILDGLA